MISNLSITRRYIPLLLLFAAGLCLFASNVSADKVCFVYAESYYEQLYCEIKAKGKGAQLPGFYDFRRNDDMTQALLLKPYARKLNINIQLPKDTARVAVPETSLAIPSATPRGHSCELNKHIIRCGNERYHWIGNQPNHQLESGALEPDNLMGLPVFNGRRQDAGAVQSYLLEGYERYLHKMLAIGLGESTLSYGKFAYLFDELHVQGVDFSERFETMYVYLKRDKRNLSVSANAHPPDNLVLADCYPLGNLWVCGSSSKRYIYVKQRQG